MPAYIDYLNAINALRMRGEAITTVAIIQTIWGSYSISHTPPSMSPNAIVGKDIRKKAAHLGIRKIGSQKVAIGSNRTTTACWA